MTTKSAVIAVENRVHDAILTALNDVVIPRVEMAKKSIKGSSGNGPKCIVQNPDRRDFTGKTEITQLRPASSRLDLKIEQDGIDETRDVDNSEDGDFPATRPIHDQRAHTHHMVTRVGCHAHHMVTGHIAPQNSIPEFLTGRPTLNNQLSEEYTQSQNMATHISPDNTLPIVGQSPQIQNCVRLNCWSTTAVYGA